MILKKSLFMGLTMVAMPTAIALTATPTFSQSSPASKDLFQCGRIEGKLTTFAYNSKTTKKTPLIHWDSKYIESKDIKGDCDNAANKFNEYYNKELEFKIVVDGNKSNRPISICLAKFKDGNCGSGEKLFSLKSEAKENLDKNLAQIVDANLAEFKSQDLTDVIKGFRQMYYPEIQPRTWWQKIFS